MKHLEKESMDVPVVVGGIIPEADREQLLSRGVARVYTPKDFDLGEILADVASLIGDAPA